MGDPVNDYGGTLGTAPGATYLLDNASSPSEGNMIDNGLAAQAVDRSRNWGAQVINMSFGGTGYYESSPLYTACQNAYNSHIKLVAGTGNSGNIPGNWPACYKPYVMGIAAHDQNGNSANFGGGQSSNSYSADLWAAGINMAVASDPGSNAYSIVSAYGTSMAAPLVSGTIAVALQRGRLTINNNTADAVYYFQSKGYYYNADRALNAIQTVQ